MGQTGNPAEAAKKEACWNTFKNLDLKISSQWQAEFADFSYYTDAERRPMEISASGQVT